MAEPYHNYSLTLPKKAVHSEADVKAQIRTALAPHFVIREEVVGRAWDGQKERIDFWCKPKPETIARRWHEGYVGIEAKGWGLQDQRKKTAARVLYQAIRYRESEFPVDAGVARPSIVLVCPAFLTILREVPTSEDAYTDEDFLNGYAFGMAKTAAMFRIGELQITGDSYEVYFHGINRWWHGARGRTGTDCLGAEDNHASR